MPYDWSAAFATMPALAYALLAVLGLIIGSFLNVVIHRLPRMLYAQWALDAATWQEDAGAAASSASSISSGATTSPNAPTWSTEPASSTSQVPTGSPASPESCATPKPPPGSALSLSHPGSYCPQCGHSLSARELIPLLSWLVQGGRCRACRAPIGITYPLVELTSALAFMALLWRFGASGQTLAALLMVSLLIALAVIDHQTRLLPDAITQPLLWSGLLVNTQALMVPLEAAVIGAAAGYLSLWTVHHAFRRLTGREGMGYGDFKLLAGLGAWLGWMALPGIVLVASAGGTLYGVSRILLRRQHRHEPIAFGPWLVLGGLVLLWLS